MTNAAVGREDLERQLEDVRALAPGEMEGVFGPEFRRLGGSIARLKYSRRWLLPPPTGSPVGRGGHRRTLEDN